MNRTYLTRELVTRDNSYSFYNFLGMLPNPDKILGRTAKGWESYRRLKDDPHVWSCVQSRKSGSLAADWLLGPGGAPASIVDKLREIIVTLGIHRLISDILEAPLFGFQPLEIMWEYTGGMLIPKSLIAKPQEWFFFDSSGKLRYRAKDNHKGVEAPAGKIICVQYEANYMNPYGSGLLSKCYWPVTFKNGGVRFWVNYMEKFGMPFITGSIGRGATFDEAQKLADELANMTQDAVIVAPSDIEIKMHEASRSSSENLYRDMIKHCNAEISKALLSQTLTTELEMGSYAAAETHFRIRREVIDSDLRLVESTINKLIGLFMEINFPGWPAPRFAMRYSDPDTNARVDRDIRLTRYTGLRFTKKHWIEDYGFKEDEIV